MQAGRPADRTGRGNRELDRDVLGLQGLDEVEIVGRDVDLFLLPQGGERACMRGGGQFALCGSPEEYDDLYLVWLIPKSTKPIALRLWQIWAIDIGLGVLLGGTAVWLLFRGRRVGWARTAA